MFDKSNKKKNSYEDRLKKYGIRIVIEDIFAPHIKHKQDKKQIIITHLSSRNSGNWTTFDLKRIRELIDELIDNKDLIFKIDETDKEGIKRLEEEKIADTEETVSLWYDKQRGDAWSEFQRKNR